jgi:hypothetical protein
MSTWTKLAVEPEPALAAALLARGSLIASCQSRGPPLRQVMSAAWSLPSWIV